LAFLASGPFDRETQVFEGWKSLDFLGFSRPDRAFSTGYAGFSAKKISPALLPAAATPEQADAAVEAVRMRRIIHGASLA
jgi:hypothetical protein